MTHPPSGPSSPPPPPGPKDYAAAPVRLAAALTLTALVLTATALCGPPGDTGGGDWRHGMNRTPATHPGRGQ